jgi:hypothetical protein
MTDWIQLIKAHIRSTRTRRALNRRTLETYAAGLWEKLFNRAYAAVEEFNQEEGFVLFSQSSPAPDFTVYRKGTSVHVRVEIDLERR